MLADIERRLSLNLGSSEVGARSRPSIRPGINDIGQQQADPDPALLEDGASLFCIGSSNDTIIEMLKNAPHGLDDEWFINSHTSRKM
jgi:hypothetical protein